jgi:uncharacterized protein YgiM (DUF1202 family)
VNVLKRDRTQLWAYVRTTEGRTGWVLGNWIQASCPAPSPR